ncbi:hypothetical protein Tco_1194688 [Tanacetum coccineum]
MTITRSGMTPEAIEEMITRRVAEAFADRSQPQLRTYVQSHARMGNDNENGKVEDEKMEMEDVQMGTKEQRLARWFKKMNHCPTSATDRPKTK